jgi:hypothetical protein
MVAMMKHVHIPMSRLTAGEVVPWVMLGVIQFFGLHWPLPSRISTELGISAFAAIAPAAGMQDVPPLPMDQDYRQVMMMV